MIDPLAPRLNGLDCLKEAIATVPIPGAPPRLSKDGAAVGLAFLDIALRQNHIRRLTERLSLIEHRIAQCTTEVDISLGMLDQEQRTAGMLYQRIRSRGAPVGGLAGDADADLAEVPRSVMWVPVSLAQRSHAPVDVISGAGHKLPRLTQYETSRLLASAMYRLLRLILTSHPDATVPGHWLGDFLNRNDKPRWLLQAALSTLLTERNKPATKPDGKAVAYWGGDAPSRTMVLDILHRYRNTLVEYIELLDLVVNDYLLVVALDPSQDEHLLAYDSPLQIERRPRWSPLHSLRRANGPYWVQYQTRLPASVRAYHLVAETEHGLAIDTMSLTSDADEPLVDGIRADLETLAIEAAKKPEADCSQRRVELELQSALRRLAELLRRRRWDASRANVALSDRGVAATRTLARAAAAAESGEDDALTAPLLQSVKAPTLAKAVKEIAKQGLHRDFSVETEPPSRRSHVYWRRDPSRYSLGQRITFSASIFIRDTSAARTTSIRNYVLAVVGLAYVLGCLALDTAWPFGALWPAGSWLPHVDAAAVARPANPSAVISVLLLVPGFLYARLDLPARQSIAGQLRGMSRLVAHITIFGAANLAAMLAATQRSVFIQGALAFCVAAPLLALSVLVIGSRAVPVERLPITVKTPRWVRSATPTRDGKPQRLRALMWRLRPPLRVPDAAYSTIPDDDQKRRRSDGSDRPDASGRRDAGRERHHHTAQSGGARAGRLLHRPPTADASGVRGPSRP